MASQYPQSQFEDRAGEKKQDTQRPCTDPHQSDVFEPATRTRGEIESAICREINRFERDYVGHGPVHIRAHLVGDLLIVRLQGVLTAAERQLVKTQLPERGQELLKQVRIAIIETTRPVIDPIVEKITGVKVVGLHHDINVAGDEFIIFTLANPPELRRKSKRLDGEPG